MTVTALDAIGGNRPLQTEEYARRAHAFVMNPQRNAVKSVQDEYNSVAATPPLLGIFNYVPWYQVREDEAHSWARAGFAWIVNDAEHCQREGWYGRQQNAMEGRVGLLQCQRLHREAFSSHGDVFQLGARATMKPYGTTYEDAERFFRAVNFPVPGQATPDDRGGYPVRTGDRVSKGQRIGKTGGGSNDPGRGNSRASHLHFIVYKNGKQIDPMKDINR
ncbi:MAG TPA: M23 family metallopeptidase, partial [Candidatus Handelsmanbacteria bacterium]|nr:M23 family metallopeptidase [Candidatus Handelsmanbacteria bacterium]